MSLQLAEEKNKTKRVDAFLVDPRNIIVDESFNVRQDYGDLESLKKSIIANGGLIEPLNCFKNHGEETYTLTDGFRRMRAIQLAIAEGHEFPYVKVNQGAKNIEDRIFAMVITGTDKKTLNILEEAEAYKMLKQKGYENKEIADKIGKSIAHVGNLLKLSDAPKQVKIAIVNESISGTTVIQLMREVQNEDELVKVVTDAINLSTKVNTNGKKKKVTLRNTNVAKFKTALEKLNEAHESINKTATHYELLEKLIDVLSDDKSPVSKVAKLFL